MIITILSGKGGTGKTTVAVNMALSLENVQLLDADVEEPNDYLFLQAEFEKNYQVVTREIPVIDENKCTACKKCVEFCHYNALALMLDKVLVFEEVCHSCGGCKIICPEGAISEQDKEMGKIWQARSEQQENLNKNLAVSQKPGLTGKQEFFQKSTFLQEPEFLQGELNIGEESAVPIIKKLKEYINLSKTVIIDAPPGTTCPTIEAVIDSDYALLVTEPTPFGLHDLKMAVDVMEEIEKPFAVVINRSEETADRLIEEYCNSRDIPVLLKIPFSRRIAELYAVGIPFVKELAEWKNKFQQLYSVIEEEVR